MEGESRVVPAEKITSSVEEPRKGWVKRGLRGVLGGASVGLGVFVVKITIRAFRGEILEDLREHLTHVIAAASAYILAGAWVGGVGSAVAGKVIGSFLGAVVGAFTGLFVGTYLKLDYVVDEGTTMIIMPAGPIVGLGAGLVAGALCGAFLERTVRRRLHDRRTSSSSGSE